jgi:hypothetical protein
MEILRRIIVGAVITGWVGALALMAWFGPDLARRFRKAASLPQVDSWTRVSGAATQLADGRILLAGMQMRGSRSAEIFDPAKGTFETVAGMNHPRRFDVLSALLSDGRVLVAGGASEGGEPIRELEAFDPVRGTWAVLGRLPVDTRPSDLVPLSDGAVLLIFGDNGAPGLLRFEPATGALAAVGHPSHVVNGTPLGTLLKDGRVLITHLEYGPGDENSSNAFLYDPTTCSTSLLPRMAQDRSQHEATRMEDGRVLISGGCEGEPSAEIFDPATRTFSGAGPMVGPRSLHTASALPDGRVLILQGVSSRRAGPMPDPVKLANMKPEEVRKAMPKVEALTCEAELYDPKVNRFSPAGDPPAPLGIGFSIGRKHGFRTREGDILFFTMNGPALFHPPTGGWRFLTVPKAPGSSVPKP